MIVHNQLLICFTLDHSFQLLGGKSFEKIHITFNIIKKLIEKCENVNY